MEKSQIKVGVDYAFRNSARGSRWGDNWRNRVRVIKVLPEVKGKYDGYSWEVKLTQAYGAMCTRGVVAGKTLYLVQYVSKDGDLYTPVGDGDPDNGREPTKSIICSGGCLTNTWAKHQAEEEARRDRAAKASADADARQAARDALTAEANTQVAALCDDMVNLLALDEIHVAQVHDTGTTVVIRLDDLAVLVNNAVEMCGGRP